MNTIKTGKVCNCDLVVNRGQHEPECRFFPTAKRAKQRPTFESIYMSTAQALAQRSTCRRLAVGAVITTPDFRKVLAVGYNGNAAGLANDCDSDEPGKCGCLHAEENAVINCDSLRPTEKIVFCTHLPCAMCAKRLINLGGVKRVVYAQDYRIRESVDIFERVGIPISQLP